MQVLSSLTKRGDPSLTLKVTGQKHQLLIKKYGVGVACSVSLHL